MGDEDKNIEIMLSVLETKHDTMGESLNELKISVKDVSGVVYDLRDRINRQNGVLPHLKESIDVMNQHFNRMEVAVNNSRDVAKSAAMRVKILWGISASIGIVLLGMLVKLLFE